MLFNNRKQYSSWGQYPKLQQSGVIVPSWHQSALESVDRSNENSYLAYGKGRSYGDSCLNENGFIIDSSNLNHIQMFDMEKGILRCESGVTFDDILSLIVPHGWFLPVTPGTRFISVGGAVANDVHGKNHHKVGSFGNHIRTIELKRSDNTTILCSENENSNYFQATIGGLGLTGLITWVEFNLKKILNDSIYVQQKTFSSIHSFFDIDEDYNNEYTVAWIDTTSVGNKLGRGVYFAGEHAKAHPVSYSKNTTSCRNLSVPLNFPGFTLNKYTVKAFNQLYFYSHQKKSGESLSHYRPFFYPLDSVSNWNRIYGKRGFFQYQCVVPIQDGKEVVTEILRLVAKRGMASFLSVLKKFGNIPAAGLMSFPREGYTLALDFPNKGQKTLQFLEDLDKLVQSVNGAIYPAKDARMSPEIFAQSFPELENFKQYVDPAFSSSFWRRVVS